jgi:hypothetical protein
MGHRWENTRPIERADRGVGLWPPSVLLPDCLLERGRHIGPELHARIPLLGRQFRYGFLVAPPQAGAPLVIGFNGVLSVAAASQGRSGSMHRAGEVQAEFLILGEANEIPLILEAPTVAVAELIQDDAPHLVDAKGMFEQFEQLR